MNNEASSIIQWGQVIRDIIAEIIWPFVLVFFIYVARDGIAQFIKRLVNLVFSHGDTRLSLQATPEPRAEELEKKRLSEMPETEKPKDIMELSLPSEEEKKNWWIQMVDAIIAGQKEEALQILEKHNASVTDSLVRLRNRSSYLYSAYFWGGDKAAFEQLKNIYDEAGDNDQKEVTGSFLAMAYSNAKNFSAERLIWEGLLKPGIPERNQATFIKNLASCLEKEQKIDEARQLIEKKLKELSDTEALCILFNKLGSLEAEQGEKLLSAIAYEKATEYKPDDEDILFNAAFAQSNTDLPCLSLFNYDTLIRLSPDKDTALNNLAVEASNLNMLGKSIKYYRRSADKGNTLAMANLAYLYIEKGFFEEASEILKKALGKKDHHPNVSAALVELEKKKKEEEDYYKKALDKAPKQRDFLRVFAEARFISTKVDNIFSKIWYSEIGNQIEFSISNSELIGKWEEPYGWLTTVKRNHTINASITNRTAKGRYTIEAFDSGTILGSQPAEYRNFLAYISEDRLKFCLMFLDKDDPMFKNFKRKPNDRPSSEN
jgi:tetratricopeptide (TPR) repeat protein